MAAPASGPRAAGTPAGTTLAGRLTLLASALALAGCASFAGIAPQSKISPVDAADTALTLPDQGGAWPGAQWAGDFGGAPLQALVDEALAGNPGLQVAAARVAAAQATADATGASALPSVGAQFSATRQRYTEHGIIPPPLAGKYVTDSQLALNFRYDFDFWGKNGAALRSALSQRKLAQAEQYNARLVLATAVVRAWLQLGRASTQLDLVTQQLGLRSALDELTRQRIAAGLDTQSENQAALQQGASLRAEQAGVREQIALARNQLAALLGRGPDRGLTIARPVLPAPAASRLPAALPLTLVGRRPDIVAARWRVEALQGRIDYARAQFYPNVDIMAFAGFSSLGLSNLLQSGSRIVGIGPAIRLPVFEGGALRAQLRGEVAGYEGAVATYRQSLDEALREVADQVQSLRAVTLQAENQQQATTAATRALTLAQQRRRVGTINQLQLLASEGVLLTQRRVAFDTQARALDLRVLLIKALGGGFDASIDHLGIAAEPVPLPSPAAASALSAASTSTTAAAAPNSTIRTAP